MIEQLSLKQKEQHNLPTSKSDLEKTSWSALFGNVEKTKQYDFYKYFLSPKLLDEIKTMLIANVPLNEEFDEVTGLLLSNQEPNTKDQLDFIRNSLFNYTNNPESAKMFYIEGVPVVEFETSDLTEEYRDAGAFVIGKPEKPIAIGYVTEQNGENYLLKALQHEMVHLAVANSGLTNIKKVDLEYDENFLLVNDVEFEEYQITLSFVDEVLAYGTNAFDADKEFSPQDIKDLFFYRQSTFIDFDLDTNAKLWAEIINKSIQDRSGKLQFKLNNYLIKNIKSVHDLDLTNEQNKKLLLHKII